MFWYWLTNHASPRVRAILAAAGAVVLLGIGGYLWLGDVTCGTDTMSAGDVCEVTHQGDTSERSFTEQRDEQRTNARIALIGGVVLAPIGPYLFWRHRRKPVSA
jgi:hypothetical protein